MGDHDAIDDGAENNNHDEDEDDAEAFLHFSLFCFFFISFPFFGGKGKLLGIEEGVLWWGRKRKGKKVRLVGIGGWIAGAPMQKNRYGRGFRRLEEDERARVWSMCSLDRSGFLGRFAWEKRKKRSESLQAGSALERVINSRFEEKIKPRSDKTYPFSFLTAFSSFYL